MGYASPGDSPESVLTWEHTRHARADACGVARAKTRL